MPSLYCSQGHENPSDNRFCRMCGEKLVLSGRQPDSGTMVGGEAETVVGLRYRIRWQLGYGGFGRTYLGEDSHRFNEPCVLKEFAPQVEGEEALRKAEALFEREAGVLYRLQHPQIPKFRELLRAEFEGRERLFLVQDYIEGQTYQDLLNTRKRHGKCFTELEVIKFLEKLLPVLQYLHSAGVIHRDISPDNLILRDADQVPVLIDFGGVKQAAVVAASEFAQPNQRWSKEAHLTLLGKPGYAPKEQIQSGNVYPHSDLYSLAVTALVLLTGQPPQILVSDDLPGYWQQHVKISQGFMYVLNKMLAPQPGNRYQSAREVLQTLRALPIQSRSPASTVQKGNAQPVQPVQYSEPSRSEPTEYVSYSESVAPKATHKATVAVVPPAYRSNRPTVTRTVTRTVNWGEWIFTIALVAGVAVAGWWVGYRWLAPWLELESQSSALLRSEE